MDADLRPEWFFGATTVGITAGTSTPDDVIDAVERGIRQLAGEGAEQPRSASCRS
jgi:4-hydroxy-3-methylbut-2-enyl diphosphate reductase IspH